MPQPAIDPNASAWAFAAAVSVNAPPLPVTASTTVTVPSAVSVITHTGGPARPTR